MKVLLIYAHPEPRSLNGALKNFAIRHLQQAGHEVQVSDLYAMRWKAGYDADDSGAPPVGEFWRPTLDSKQAFAQGTQSADIVAEQEKMRACFIAEQGSDMIPSFFRRIRGGG